MKWGTDGPADGQFRALYGIALDKGGNVYAVEMTGKRVQRFASDGTFLLKLGAWGSGPGEFQGASSVAVDASGNIYVGDQSLCRVQEYGVAAAVGRPDGRIRLGAAGAFAGDDVYNTTGAGQAKQGSARVGRSVTFGVSVQNDGATDTFRVRAPGSTSAFAVRYRAGGVDVTPRVVAGTYETPALGRGGTVLLTATVTVRPGAASRIARLVTVSSKADPSRKDAVKLVVKRG
jgi:hypothetical protein